MIILDHGGYPNVPIKQEKKKKKAKTHEEIIKIEPLVSLPKSLKKGVRKDSKKILNFDDEIIPDNEEHGKKKMEAYEL